MKSLEASSNPWNSLLRQLAARLRAADKRWDCRGWIALAWVLWWGWLYSLMVLETKFPQVLTWLCGIRK
jgi:hypothetical protein